EILRQRLQLHDARCEQEWGFVVPCPRGGFCLPQWRIARYQAVDLVKSSRGFTDVMVETAQGPTVQCLCAPLNRERHASCTQKSLAMAKPAYCAQRGRLRAAEPVCCVAGETGTMTPQQIARQREQLRPHVRVHRPFAGRVCDHGVVEPEPFVRRNEVIM